MTKISRQRGLTLLELAVVVAILVVLVSLLVMKVDKIKENADETGTRATLNTMREAFVGSAGGPGFLSDMKHVPGFDALMLTLQVRDLLDPVRFSTEAQKYDPIAQRGWRGPYLDNVQPVRNTNPIRTGRFPDANERRQDDDFTFYDRHFYDSPSHSPYGEPNDRAAADVWGNPIVLQIPPASVFTNGTDAKRFRYARLVSAGADGVLETPSEGPSGRLAGLLSDGTIIARGDDVVIFLNRADVYEDEEDP